MAATDVERLVVSMEAKLSKFDKDLRKAIGMSDRTAKSIENRFSRMEKRLATAGQNIGRNLIAPIAGAVAFREVTRMADSFVSMSNRLRAVGVPAKELTGTMDRLKAIALEAGTSWENTVDTFARLSRVQKEVGASSADIFEATRRINLVMGSSGAGPAQMESALTQMTQAFGDAVVQWADFKPLLDTAPALMQATANGIDEAGGSVQKLTKLVKDGRLSGEAYFKGLMRGSARAADEAAKMPRTIAQRVGNLNTALTDVIGKMDQTTGTTGEMNKVFDRLHEIISDPNFASGLQGIAAAIGAIGLAAAETLRMIGNFGQHLELQAQRWNMFAHTISGGLIKNTTGAPAGMEPGRFMFPGNANDPKLLAALQKKAVMSGGNLIAPTGGDAGGGTSSGSSPELLPAKMDEAAKAAENEAKRIRELVAALQFEASIRGMSEETQETQRRLREAGAAATEKQRQAIISLTHKEYAAAAAADRLKEAQEQLNQTVSDFGNMGLNALDSFIVQGNEAKDVMADLARTIASAALQAAILGQGPFASLFGTAPATAGGTGGLVGALAGALTPRATGGPVSPGRGYLVGEDGPEVFLPRVGGKIAPNGGSGETVVRLDLSPDVEARVIRQSGTQARVMIERNNQGIISARRHGSRAL